MPRFCHGQDEWQVTSDKEKENGSRGLSPHLSRSMRCKKFPNNTARPVIMGCSTPMLAAIPTILNITARSWSGPLGQTGCLIPIHRPRKALIRITSWVGHHDGVAVAKRAGWLAGCPVLYRTLPARCWSKNVPVSHAAKAFCQACQGYDRQTIFWALTENDKRGERVCTTNRQTTVFGRRYAIN